MRRLLYISVIALIMTLCQKPALSGRVAGTDDVDDVSMPDTYRAAIDSIRHYYYSNRSAEAFSLVRRLYTTALERQSDYALCKAHGAFAMIYDERQDSSRVVFHLTKALEYASRCTPKPRTTDYYLGIYKYTFDNKGLTSPDAISTLQKALEVAQCEEDTFRTTVLLACHYGRIGDKGNFERCLKKIKETETPEYIDRISSIYYRAISYPYIFSSHMDSAVAVRRNIPDARERFTSIYYMARFLHPRRLQLALEYCDSIDSLNWVAQQMFDNTSLKEMVGMVRKSRLASQEAEQKALLLAEKMEEGKELIARNRLDKEHQQNILNNKKLQQKKQEADNELSLMMDKLQQKNLILNNQKHQYRNQQLRKAQFENQSKKTYLFLFALVAAFMLAATLLWGTHNQRMAKRIAVLRKEEKRLMNIAVRASKRKDEFIRSMSYDVRTPLNNVAGFAQLLAQPRETLTDEERQRFGVLIQEDAMKLTEYIDSILSSHSKKDDETQPASMEERENTIRQHLRALHLLKMMLPLAMLTAAPLFMSSPMARNIAADTAPKKTDSLEREAYRSIREGRTLDAIRQLKRLKDKATANNDIDLSYRVHLGYADAFIKRHSFFRVVPHLKQALQYNERRPSPDNPTQIYCGLFDNAAMCMKLRDDNYLATLLKTLDYADTPQRLRKTYVRIAACYAYRNDRDNFDRYYRLCDSLRNISPAADDSCHVFANYHSGTKILSLLDAYHQYFTHGRKAAEKMLEDYIEPDERLELMGLLARISGEYGEALAHRDTLTAIRMAQIRQRDMADSLYIDSITGNDSIEQAMIRNTIDLNNTIIRRQQMAIERYELAADNHRQEIKRMGIEMAVREKKQRMLMRNNEMKRSRLALRKQYLVLRNEQLTMERNEARFTINVMIILLTLLLLLAITAFLIQMVRRRHISKMMEMTNNMHKARTEAIQATEMKDKFIQNMSHEIRTPLNAISGFAQLLALPADSFSDEERKEFAMHINHNITLLTMLIDDIINIGEIEKGVYHFEKKAWKANDLAQRAMSVVRYRVPGNITLAFDTSLEDSHEIVTDGHRVQQVLINYLTNAIKHTSEGSITVTVSEDTLDRKPAIKYTVSDTGEGIPKADAEVIFERFVKLNDFIQGTGLGLNICRTISKNLNGRVYVDTSYPECDPKTDHGARFVFVVPAA
ncbi:MAG: histidine kinase dimerization/phospho-acceptor domain-containing protein [Prevotella sp.]